MEECSLKYEYWDETLEICKSCDNLCCRGLAALPVCKKTCNAFVEDCMEAKGNYSCKDLNTCKKLIPSYPNTLATTSYGNYTDSINETDGDSGQQIIIVLSILVILLLLIAGTCAIVYYKRKFWNLCRKKMQRPNTDTENAELSPLHVDVPLLSLSGINASQNQTPLEQDVDQAPPSPHIVSLSSESLEQGFSESDPHGRPGTDSSRRPETDSSVQRPVSDPSPQRSPSLQDESQETVLKNQYVDQTNPTLSRIVENRESGNDTRQEAAANDVDDEDTPLWKPAETTQQDRVPHTELRQQPSLLGRQVSELHRNPSDPGAQRYEEETLQSLRAGDLLKADMVAPEHSHLLSIRDELVPESLTTKPLPTAPLDKFQVTEVLDVLEWVLQYMLDEEKIDVFVNFDAFTHLTYLVIIEILKKYTLRPEMDFRVKEMLPCLFTPLAGVVPGVTHAETLVPGAEIKIPREPQPKTAACGLYIRCKQNGKFVYYAVTAGHAIREDDVCFFNAIPMGKCILKIERKEPPRTMDIAVIKIFKDFTMDNTVFSAQGNKCGFRLPANMEEVCAMECWKIQRKSRESWQYGYLRYAVLTNKEHGFYRCIGVVRAHETCPVIREGDCGCLVTSLPREDRLTIYGMMLGRLTQTAEDGSEEDVEMYIAFPFKEALEELQQHRMFAGKGLEIVPADDHSVTGIT